jgi:hypothetical protein
VFRTLLLSALGLSLAAGGPWAYERASTYWKSSSTPAPKPSTPAPPASIPSERTLEESRVSLAPNALPTDAAPNYDLESVLRFDVSPSEVLKRWPRVSTGMGQVQLMGYRVLLVSGTGENDLAGSLTYYFDNQQRCQRIAFYGTTGNPQRLVTLLSQRFSFTRRVVNDPGLFIYEVPNSDGPSPSVLQLQSASIIKQAEPYRRYKLSLVIERPA